MGQPAPVGQLNTCRAPAADQGEQGGAARRPAAGGVAPAGVENVERLRGYSRARSHCRFVLPLIHFIPYPLTYPVHLFLKRQCDRTLGYCAGGGLLRGRDESRAAPSASEKDDKLTLRTTI